MDAYIDTNSIIFISDQTSVGFLDSENNIPSFFQLPQNYPNPFNPSTTIGFDLAEATNVSLTIYDTQGHQISQLVNGQMQAGSQSVILNAEILATGIYFYKLQAGSFTQVKKMTLMK